MRSCRLDDSSRTTISSSSRGLLCVQSAREEGKKMVGHAFSDDHGAFDCSREIEKGSI